MRHITRGSSGSSTESGGRGDSPPRPSSKSMKGRGDSPSRGRVTRVGVEAGAGSVAVAVATAVAVAVAVAMVVAGVRTGAGARARAGSSGDRGRSSSRSGSSSITRRRGRAASRTSTGSPSPSPSTRRVPSRRRTRSATTPQRQPQQWPRLTIAMRADNAARLAGRGLLSNLFLGDFVEACYPFTLRSPTLLAAVRAGACLAGAILFAHGPDRCPSSAYLPLPVAVWAVWARGTWVDTEVFMAALAGAFVVPFVAAWILLRRPADTPPQDHAD